MKSLIRLDIRRQFITDCIKDFKKNYYTEYLVIVKNVKQLRKSRNEFASDKEKDMRWALRLPRILFLMIDYSLENPRFLEDKSEIHWFMKVFKEFCIPEKI